MKKGLCFLIILATNCAFAQQIEELQDLSYKKDGIKKITIQRKYALSDTFLLKEVLFDSIGRVVKEIFDYKDSSSFREIKYTYTTAGFCVHSPNPSPISFSKNPFIMIKRVQYTYKGLKIKKIEKIFDGGETNVLNFEYPELGALKIIKKVYENGVLHHTDFFKLNYW